MINYREIPFINGYTEFLEIFSKSIEIKRKDVNTNLKIELSEAEVIPESISYYTENNEGSNLRLTISKEEGVSYLNIFIESEIKELHIKVSYSYKSIEPKYLFSIDYDKGVIFFSEPLSSEIIINYESDKILLTGRKSKQLEPTEFSYVDGKVNIFNYKENTSISFLYTNKKEVKRNVSPVLQDLKINYITMDPRSL